MKEITVIAKNQPGEVAHLANVLAERGINIEDIDAETNGSSGLIHLVVDQYDEALRALRDADFQAITEDALVIKLDDKPGALAKVASRFGAEKINLRSMHIMEREPGQYVIVSLVTENNLLAAELVKDVAVRQGGT